MNSSLDVFERFTARFTGPMHARFIIQPAMAIILGIRDGFQDARCGAPPFFWDVVTTSQGRKAKLSYLLRRLVIPMTLAIVLDGIVQYLLFQRIRVLGAVIIGVTLMGLPYSIARGLTNRLVSARSHGRLVTGPRRG